MATQLVISGHKLRIPDEETLVGSWAKTLEIEPENPDAYQNLSIAYFRMGRNNEGMKLMRENAGVISFTMEKSRGNIQVLKD